MARTKQMTHVNKSKERDKPLKEDLDRLRKEKEKNKDKTQLERDLDEPMMGDENKRNEDEEK